MGINTREGFGPIVGGGGRTIAAILLQEYAGLDVESDHGADTPKRFLTTLNELTSCRNTVGDDAHLQECVKWKTFPATSDDMLVVGPISFVSMCNHHVLPFHGKAWIGYVPDVEIAGLSKFARVVNHFARQLQVQEDLTAQITDFLDYHLAPKGVTVLMKAEHTCMTFRGAQSPGTLTKTSAVRGVFADHARTAKAEFLSLIGDMQ